MPSHLLDNLDQLLLPHGGDHAVRTVVLAAVPLALAWAYVRFVRVPPRERPVKFAWDVPEEAE